MNATINSQRLAAELRLLNKIVPAKPAIQILSHMLVKAGAGMLSLYATDLEIGLVTTCPARVGEPGALALPVAKFLALVEQFPDADVSIVLSGQQVVVQCGAFRSRLQVLSADEFPETPKVEGTSSTLDMEVVHQLIACTRYAVAELSNRHLLRGALLTLTGGVAAMVATDSKRLALATRSRTGPDMSAIVPAKTLDALSNQGSVGDVEFTIGVQHLFFQMDNRLLISRTFDGEYPKYERIIPRDNDKIITVDKEALAAALRRITLVSEESRAVYFDISAEGIELSSSSAEVGSANERVVAGYDGTPLKVCINGTYVLDFLNAALGQTITLALKDIRSAMLLTDGSDHIAVIMVMRA